MTRWARSRLPDTSATAGGLVWLGLVAAGRLDPTEQALALAPLVLVPLALRTVADAEFGTAGGRLLDVAVLCQPVAATLVAASLALPVAGPTAAALSVPWLVVSALLVGTALVRTRQRGGLALPATAVDAGLAYLPVAAVALVAFHADVTLWFSAVLIRLTAVHFHYAGFVLAVVAGLTARAVGSRPRGFEGTLWVVVVGPALVGLGIAFSPLVEVVAVTTFTVAVALFGGFVLRHAVPGRPRTQRVLLTAAALALPVSMALALGYGVATYTGTAIGPDIATMVALHGRLNAFGFGLCAVVGWRLAPPSDELT